MLYKIYKIVNNVDDRIYVGFTQQPLYKRWNDHKKRWRNKNITQYSSSILFDFCGYENCRIVLENEYELYNIEQIKQKEQDTINKYKSICVNKYKSVVTEEDKKINREKYNETRKIKSHTEEFKIKDTAYRSRRICCVLCKKEMRFDSLTHHLKNIKH